MSAYTLAADMIATDAMIGLIERERDWLRTRLGQFSNEQLLYGASLSQAEIDAIMDDLPEDTL